MPSRFDTRQSIIRDILSRVSPVQNSELDNALRSINSELTPPLELRAEDTPSLVVNIGSSLVDNNENQSFKRGVPPLGLGVPNISGTLTFPASSSGTVVVSNGNDLAVNLVDGFHPFSLFVDPGLQFNLINGAVGVDFNAALANALPTPGGSLPLGVIVVQVSSGALQVIDQGSIIQFAAAGGAGGGAGDTTDVLERMKDRLEESDFEFLAANVFSINEDDLIDSSVNAAFNVVNSQFEFQGAASQLSSINLFNTSVVPAGFIPTELEVALYFGQIDAATPMVEISIDGGTTFEVVTMESLSGTDLIRGQIEVGVPASLTGMTPDTPDLRVRITSTEAQSLTGIAINYGSTIPAVAQEVSPFQRFTVNGDDNTTQFIINRFRPSPDTTFLFDINAGQVLAYPAFDISGQTITVADGQFFQPGVSIPLLFFNVVSSFDASDQNAALLAENRLGSLDPSVDRSQAGEGFFVRRKDGQLVEFSVDSNNNIVISEV